MRAEAAVTTVEASLRADLESLDLSPGKRARLRRIFSIGAPGGARALILPVDQGLEHGPSDFFPNPAAVDPAYQVRLALEGGFTGLAFQVGIAEKYLSGFGGRVPLLLKLNGKTNIPDEEAPLSPLTALPEDAARLGADAVGYTLYVGSPRQDEDFRQFQEVRRRSEALGLPVVVWAYPRGKAVEAKGGKESLWAVEYAARVAQELGADVVKVNLPQAGKGPGPYQDFTPDPVESVRRVVRAAGRTLVLFSGGGKVSDADLIHRAEVAVAGGASGFIFGRNLWQRPWDDALHVSARLRAILGRGELPAPPG